MISQATGSMFDAEVDARVNTVNCVGVMGAGVALAFKKRYPDMFKEYQRVCASGELRPGKLFVWRSLSGDCVINFPTKLHWREPSRYEYIKSGLDALRDQLIDQPVRRIAVPALGCGHGGLDWAVVKPMIADSLGGLSTEVLLYEPSDSRELPAKDRDKLTPEDELQLRRLGFSYLDQAIPTALPFPLGATSSGDTELLTSDWYAFLHSGQVQDKELGALEAIGTGLKRARPSAVAALVYMGESSRNVADVLRKAGLRTVVLLPFGPLNRPKSVGSLLVPSGRLVISCAAPGAAWSRAVFASAMDALRAHSVGTLLSSPDPSWIKPNSLGKWRSKPAFFIRYEETDGAMVATLEGQGFRQLKRKASDGLPNLSEFVGQPDGGELKFVRVRPEILRRIASSLETACIESVLIELPSNLAESIQDVEQVSSVSKR